MLLQTPGRDPLSLFVFKYDTNAISATMENGLLSITIPVAEEAKPKTITIK